MILVLADMVNICDSLHVSWDTIIQVVPTDVDDRWTNPTATPCRPLMFLLLGGGDWKAPEPEYSGNISGKTSASNSHISSKSISSSSSNNPDMYAWDEPFNSHALGIMYGLWIHVYIRIVL